MKGWCLPLDLHKEGESLGELHKNVRQYLHCLDVSIQV
jgi:hypothetical protein